MDIEQRAHEVALEIMKMHFEINRSKYESDAADSDGEKNVPTNLLADVYSVAYHHIIDDEIEK
ncbi:MAG: hypothetical protein IJ642_11500 [Oscillospiraceae bacterium]|nr:hypothetical protein [Oscillospiraceae bacterium]